MIREKICPNTAEEMAARSVKFYSMLLPGKEGPKGGVCPHGGWVRLLEVAAEEGGVEENAAATQRAGQLHPC
jgi:hypothetical protein